MNEQKHDSTKLFDVLNICLDIIMSCFIISVNKDWNIIFISVYLNTPWPVWISCLIVVGFGILIVFVIKHISARIGKYCITTAHTISDIVIGHCPCLCLYEHLLHNNLMCVSWDELILLRIVSFLFSYTSSRKAIGMAQCPVSVVCCQHFTSNYISD